MDIGPSPLKRHRGADALSDVEELQGVRGGAASPQAPSASPPLATSPELALRMRQTMQIGEKEAGVASRGGSTERQVVEGGGASDEAAAVVTGKCNPAYCGSCKQLQEGCQCFDAEDPA